MTSRSTDPFLQDAAHEFLDRQTGWVTTSQLSMHLTSEARRAKRDDLLIQHPTQHWTEIPGSLAAKVAASLDGIESKQVTGKRDRRWALATSIARWTDRESRAAAFTAEAERRITTNVERDLVTGAIVRASVFIDDEHIAATFTPVGAVLDGEFIWHQANEYAIASRKRFVKLALANLVDNKDEIEDHVMTTIPADVHAGTTTAELARVRAYLPANYAAHQLTDDLVHIQGRDSAGWTWVDYVKPRLASGLISVTDVEPIVEPEAEPDLLDLLTRLDEGELSEEEYIALFQGLVDNGMAWTLQGRIGRAAADLIEAGLVKVKS